MAQSSPPQAQLLALQVAHDDDIAVPQRWRNTAFRFQTFADVNPCSIVVDRKQDICRKTDERIGLPLLFDVRNIADGGQSIRKQLGIRAYFVTLSARSIVLSVAYRTALMTRRDVELDKWFTEQVLPLEPLLMHFLRRNWHAVEDLPDIRQDVYTKVYDAARQTRPDNPKAFLISVARNHLINAGKRARIVSFEAIASMETLSVEEITPERHAIARDELRHVRDGLDKLPRRCRQVVELRKVSGLSQHEVAARMGIGVETVRRQLALGMRALADHMLGGDGRVRRDVVQPISRKYRSWR